MFSNPSWPFPQSFDTPDVKEAVLAQLSAPQTTLSPELSIGARLRVYT